VLIHRGRLSAGRPSLPRLRSELRGRAGLSRLTRHREPRLMTPTRKRSHATWYSLIGPVYVPAKSRAPTARICRHCSKPSRRVVKIGLAARLGNMHAKASECV